MFSLRASEKKLGFSVHVDSSLPDRLYGDEVRLQQIMGNLLSNAFKYTREGSIVLSVGRAEDSRSPAEGTVLLEISVQDTGIGIREEDLDKLFNKFERMDLRRNSTVEGTGLGLAITRSLLDMMHGSIHVESTYGKGSVFRVTLPQKAVSAEPIGIFRCPVSGDGPQSRAPRRMPFRAPDARILAVDDTRINLMVTTGLLEDTGIRIDTASCGPEAIRLAEAAPYDLILMDQRMPEMDGVETMRRIRGGKGPNAGTPFICLTADAVAGAREHYLSEGFTDYLSKPVSGDALEETVLRYLPAEKILTDGEHGEERPAERAGTPAAYPNQDYEGLRQAGIDTAAGLANSQGMHDLYRELLSEFARGAEAKAGNLNRCLEARDWQNYTVFVHALKSSARLIGAGELSRMAAALEQAGIGEAEDAILDGHPAMMAEYERVTEAVRAAPFFEPGAGSEPEIMDFPAL